jgi:NAD(P)-dependent dehydrogenase (short-subunit alcohol dehydrogenase family)
MKLQDKVAIVTGAGSGIGRAIAQRLASEGARVVAADVIEERVKETVALITASGGAAASSVGDISIDTDVGRIVETATQTYGRLDILCNNAGIMDRYAPITDTPDDLWQRVLGINLTGAFYMCRKAIPVMLAQGGGAIVNTASIAGIRGGRAGVAYTASKHGLVGLTQNIVYFFGEKGIRCNAICPGGIETSIGVGGQPSVEGMERAQRYFKLMPRFGKADDVANVVAFLVSDDSRYVNGSVITVDGGWASY